MAAEEQEGASNSLNVKTLVYSRSKAVSKVEVNLSDGSSFLLPQELILSEGLHPGSTINKTDLPGFVFLAEVYYAKLKALELLSYRAHSSAQLRQKLEKREFSREAIAKVIKSLRETGYVDDEAFAREWLTSQLKRRPSGYSRLLGGLLRTGIMRSVAEDLLNDVYTEEAQLNALSAAAEKLLRKDSITRQQIIKSLTIKGFPYYTICDYIDKLTVFDAEKR